MANPVVQIILKAINEASDVIDDIKDSFSGLGTGAEDAEKVTSDALGDMFDNAMDAFTGINQGIELAMKAFDALKLAYDGTVGKVLEIAGEVEEFVRISGDAPENMSALRLEAEKADVPFDDLYKAMENLNKNGVPPTLDNLVAIADEYGNLEDPIDRARFLTEKFGEAGDDIAPMLEGIADGVTAVQDAGLIFTEDELQDIRDYEEAVANLGLAWDGLATSIGMAVIPSLTDFFELLKRDFETFGLMGQYVSALNQGFKDGNIDVFDYAAGLINLAKVDLNSAESVKWLKDEVDELNKSTDDSIPTFEEYRAQQNMMKVTGDNTRKVLEGMTAEVYNGEIAMKNAAEAAETLNNTEIVPKTVEIDVNDGPSKEKIEQLRQMGIEDKEFTVKAEVDDSKVRNWQPPSKTGTVTYSPVKGGLYAAGGAIHAAASGLAASLSSYWVGERGPEPFFPAIDGRIVSNTQAMAALRGGAGVNSREIANAVREGVKDAMRETKAGNVYNLTMPTSSNTADVRTAFELMEAWGA